MPFPKPKPEPKPSPSPKPFTKPSSHPSPYPKPSSPQTLPRYGSQKARKPPPKCGVLSDEGPANSIADHCRRKDTAPLPPSSAAASLRRALTQRCQI